MFNAILIIITIFALAAWLNEKFEGNASLRAAKRYRYERDEEAKLRRKAQSDIEGLIENEHVLRRRNESLQNTCDALAQENANIYSEREKLRHCTVDYALSDWERRECVDATAVEYERDGIVLILEGGKIVGWHGADTVQICFRGEENPSSIATSPEGKAEYAEVYMNSEVASTCENADDIF